MIENECLNCSKAKLRWEWHEGIGELNGKEERESKRKQMSKGMFGMTWIVIFITKNKMCCNVIIKPIHKFGCEL